MPVAINAEPVATKKVDNTPTQLHLSITNDPSEMIVMWSTQTKCRSMVEYCQDNHPELVFRQRGKRCVTHSGWDRFMHTVKLSELHLDVRYRYRVGDPVSNKWSQWWWFETRPAIDFDGAVVAVVGDFDKTEAAKQHIEALAESIENWDLLVVAGDLCYAKGQTSVWDLWGEIFEPIAAIRPLMVLPGNHENETKFGKGWDAYNLRYKMPSHNGRNGWKNQYYSFRFGNTHFTVISTEDDLSPTSPQGIWLQEDLARAHDSEDKPWIVVLGHKPIYGSADKKWFYKQECGPTLRNLLEPYFIRYGVQLAMFGHVHCYERTQSINGVTYITAGTGGAKLDNSWVEPQPEWSAERMSNYGCCFLQLRSKDYIQVDFKGCTSTASEALTASTSEANFEFTLLDSVQLFK